MRLRRKTPEPPPQPQLTPEQLIVSAFTLSFNADEIDGSEEDRLYAEAEDTAKRFLHYHDPDTVRAIAQRLRDAADNRDDPLIAEIERRSNFPWTGYEENWPRFQKVARLIADRIDAAT